LSWENFTVLIFGAVLVGLVFLQVDAFKWLGVPVAFPPNHWNLLLFVGLALLFAGFRMLPSAARVSDIPRWAAYGLLAVILGVAMFLRLYRIDEPFGYYWDDPAICIIDPRNLLDLHEFRMTFAIGLREPLFPYVAAGFWWFFPAMKPLIVQRLVSAFFDLAALWVFYLLGREISGKRRVGVLLTAFAAVSKPMIMQNLCGMGGLTMSLGIGLMLLTQVRLFRKPNLGHFIQWGIALAFGVYTYIAIRPWIVFLALVTLGWILWKKRTESSRWQVKAAAGLMALGFFAFFLDKLLFFLRGNLISQLWSEKLAVWLLLQALFLGAFIFLHTSSKGLSSEEKDRQLTGWAMGLLLAGVFIYPLAVDPEVSLKIRDLSLLPKQSSQWFSAEFFHRIQDQVTTTIRNIFIGGNDRNDMNVVGDPFFEFHGVILALVGLTFAAARPTWWKTFLVLCAFVGILPHLLTSDPTSAKLLGALAPLLLLAAMAFDRWFDACFAGAAKGRFLGLLLMAGLAVFWAWDGQGTFIRVYDKWWNYLSPDVQVYREVKQDVGNKRVYFLGYHGLGFFSPAVQGVLFNGEAIYDFQPQNTIDVLPDEKRQDVSVIVAAMDQGMVSKLKNEYPGAQWNPAWMFYENKAIEKPYFYRVVIPADQISETPGKSFVFHVVPGRNWLRRTYVTYFGLTQCMIAWESLSPTLNPLPPESGAHSASADGQWNAPANGSYTFSFNGPDVTQLWVDGKKVFDYKPVSLFRSVSGTIYLAQGIHSIRCLTWLRTYPWFPDIKVRNAALGVDEILGK
jgi:hypothetical protein